MKWQGCLLIAIVLTSPGLAQEPIAGPIRSQVPTPVLTASYADAPVMTEMSSGSDPGSLLGGNHNFRNFIGFLSDPLQAIDPRAVTAIYPIFGSAWLKTEPPIPDGDVQLYGPALTIALSERLAVGLSQGGYATAHLNRNPDPRFANRPIAARFFEARGFGGERDGWLNLGGFAQYALVENVDDQFILTGGLRWMAPAGSHELFQGHGPLELAPYMTFGKELGKFHVLGTLGYMFPAGPGDDNLHAFNLNLHLDRQTCDWLYPLVEFNGSFLTKSVAVGLTTRTGYIDFGNFEGTGNIVTVAVGANAVLVPERLELGAVYMTPIATQRDFSYNGLLVKMTLRF